MMQGEIPVTWNKNDYQNLIWVTNREPEEKLNATVDTARYDVGVYMCYENLPKVFKQAGESFGLGKTVVAVNKLVPGQILPYHTDKYETYKKRNNILDTDNIKRIIVFLHDQKAGHQLWIKDKICIGTAGTFFGWDQGTEHMAANLGQEDRYILQVTGIAC